MTHQNKIKNQKYAFDLESFLCACLLKQSRSAHSCTSLTVKHIVRCPSWRCTDVSFPATCVAPQPQDAVAFKRSVFLFHHGEQPPPSASLAITINPFFTKTLLLLILFLNPFVHDDALVAATASSRRISFNGAPIIDTTC